VLKRSTALRAAGLAALTAGLALSVAPASAAPALEEAPVAQQPDAAPPTRHATLSADGRRAVAPEGAPAAVVGAIAAANRITDAPYVYGGGHGSFAAAGYDCSGAVSFALHGAGKLDAPLASGPLGAYGEPGPGRWITVRANAGHAYVEIAGLRFDTSGAGAEGPRWRPEPEAGANGPYTLRHPAGL
jgi:cell wall-associated NlpC family hydrolase